MVLGIVASCWILSPRGNAFAKTIEGINVATTITWVRTGYMRMISKDGKRKWLDRTEHRTTYMSPGFRRCETFDEHGKLKRVSISDPLKKQNFTLYFENKSFEITDHEVFEPDSKKKNQAAPPKMKLAKLNVGPFAWFNRAVTAGGEIVGQRMVDGRKVNVLRWHNLAMGIHNPKNVSDVWIDAESEEIVGTSHPGSSFFDPEKLEYRDNASEDRCSGAKILGSITKDIQLDPKVDPSIFEFNVPHGFNRAPKRKAPAVITETELVEWLEILAKVNDNQFVDGVIIRNTKKIAEASAQENPSQLEKMRRKIWYRHMLNDNTDPFWDFLDSNTFRKDYMYLGKGVKLGATDTPILIYRLKLTGKYRVLYGDLRIADISDDAAKELKATALP